MAKGAESKARIIEKILEVFEGSFQHEKEIRIPMQEDGSTVEIKVSLTCAKTNVGAGVPPITPDLGKTTDPDPALSSAPTAEEKAAVKALCEKLNLTF